MPLEIIDATRVKVHHKQKTKNKLQITLVPLVNITAKQHGESTKDLSFQNAAQWLNDDL